MGIPTFAIILGVSRYTAPQLSCIPAAASDAICFSRALVNWGLETKNLHLFLNEEATSEQLFGCFAKLLAKEDPFKLLFYFAGHGTRLASPDPLSYLLLHDSVIESKQVSKGLNLDDLVGFLGKVQSTENYLFLDACSLRISKLSHPLLQDELGNLDSKRKKFFCMLSSGIENSYESALSNEGYFTRALLKVLAKNKKIATTEFAEAINEEMNSLDLPLPEMYNIETYWIDFLSLSNASLSSSPFLRKELLSLFQKAFLSSDLRPYLVFGKKGIGKTAFAKRLAEAPGSIYLEIRDSPFATIESLKIILGFSDLNVENFFEKMRNSYPWLLLIFDQVGDEFSGLENWINQARNSQGKAIFFLSEYMQEKAYLYHLPSWHIPIWSKNEIFDYIDKQEKSSYTLQEKELLFTLSKGIPQKADELIQHFASLISFIREENSLEILQAVRSCIYYFDEVVFLKVFHFDEVTLQKLKNLGVIINLNGKWMIEEAIENFTLNTDIDPLLGLKYWKKQCEEIRDPNLYGEVLIHILGKTGYRKEFKGLLKKIFKQFSQDIEKNSHVFRDAVQIYIKSRHPKEESIELAEILTQINDCEEDLLELTGLPFKNKKLKLRALHIQVHYLRKQGKQKQALALIDPNSEIYRSRSSLANAILLEKALALFELGRWKESYAELTHLEKKTTTHYQQASCACILGTIIGYIDPSADKGVKLIKKSIEIAAGNEILTWSAYNNLGEIFCYRGEFEKSHAYLKLALSLGKKRQKQPEIMETKRNLLELYSRLYGSQDSRVDRMLQSLDPCCLPHPSQTYAYNSLARIYAQKGDLMKSCLFLKLALENSLKDENCRIYFLKNLALLFELKGEKNKVQFLIEKARKYARNVGNQFACKQ